MNDVPVKWVDLRPDGTIVVDGLPVFNHIKGATAYHLYNDEHELIAIVKVRLSVSSPVYEDA